MDPQSTRALIFASLVPAILGPITTSFAANFLFPLLAFVLAILPAMFGRGRARIVAGIVVVVSLALAASAYPGYRAEMDRWKARAEAEARPGP